MLITALMSSEVQIFTFLLFVDALRFMRVITEIGFHIEKSSWRTVHYVIFAVVAVDKFRTACVVRNDPGEPFGTRGLIFGRQSFVVIFSHALSRSSYTLYLLRVVAFQGFGVEQGARRAVLYVPSSLPAVQKLVAGQFVYQLPCEAFWTFGVYFNAPDPSVS